MGRLVISFEKNIKKFSWDVADERSTGFYTGELSKEEFLRLIKVLYTERRLVYIGQKFMMAYQSTTPNWEEDFKKAGIKVDKWQKKQSLKKK